MIETTAIHWERVEHADGGHVTRVGQRSPTVVSSSRSRSASAYVPLRWRATGIVLPLETVLPDGRGGWELFEHGAFAADEERGVFVHEGHDPRRVLGSGIVIRLGDELHARTDVAEPPYPAAWSVHFEPLSWRDVDGVRRHRACRLIEISLVRPELAVHRGRTPATVRMVR